MQKITTNGFASRLAILAFLGMTALISACASTPPGGKVSFVPPVERANDQGTIELEKRSERPPLVRASLATGQAEDEGFSLCNCKEKVDPIKALLAQEQATTRSLQSSLRVLRESFQYVELTWAKKALYSLGQYDEDILSREGTAETVSTLDYNEATVEAVKNFQCLYHPKASDGTCDKAKTTGWITYPEARAAICTSGYAGQDDTAILLAGWYANGTVFERNLSHANWLVNKLSKNLPALIQNTQEGPDREFYLAIESDARILQNFINSMVNAEAEIRELTNAQRAALRGDPNAILTLAEICPRGV